MRQTAYSEYVSGYIVARYGGGGSFNAAELAESAGLRLTGNLRRRLRQMVEAGALHSFPCYNHNNRVEIRYTFAYAPKPQLDIEPCDEIPF